MMSGSRSWRASSNSFRALAMSLSRHTTPSLSCRQSSARQRSCEHGTAQRPGGVLPACCESKGGSRQRGGERGQDDRPREVAGGADDVAVQAQCLFPLEVSVRPRPLWGRDRDGAVSLTTHVRPTHTHATTPARSRGPWGLGARTSRTSSTGSLSPRKSRRGNHPYLAARTTVPRPARQHAIDVLSSLHRISPADCPDTRRWGCAGCCWWRPRRRRPPLVPLCCRSVPRRRGRFRAPLRCARRCGVVRRRRPVSPL